MTKLKTIFLADLTHTHSGIQALTFPLGTAYVAAYAQKILGQSFEFKLFKFPEKLSQAIDAGHPRVLALSNYSWNLELGCKLAAWAKRRHPGLVVVMGGPNFSIWKNEKIEFLQTRSAIDFYIESEGELGFSELLKKLDEHNFDADSLKRTGTRVTNCTYLQGDTLIEGEVERIKDITTIPSPYLSGLLDDFFELPLSPMIETTRGCPFSCTFCSDGLEIKNKVVAFEPERVKAELSYIAQRVKFSDEINITDLNFGMYREDLDTAKAIVEIQSKYNWPKLIKASAGKNKTERILEVVSLLNGSWVVGSAVQSSNKQVLKNVKRANISTKSYQQFVDFTHSNNKAASTFTEIILGLPGDSKSTHFDSLRYGVESKINNVKSYQAMLLAGTDMATPATREIFGLLTKFRVMAGGVGSYKFGQDEARVAEIQEIIVGSKDLPFEDYITCRLMSLIIESYYNNGLSRETFTALEAMDVSVFDFLVFLLEHSEFYTPNVKAIIKKFEEGSRSNLYDSHSEAEKAALSPGLFERYLSGDIGFNEALECKAELYAEMEDTQAVLSNALNTYLENTGLNSQSVCDYFEQVGQFSLARKKQLFDCDLVIEQSFYYDFVEIDSLNYMIDPRHIEKLSRPITFKFFHNPEQILQIKNAVRMYQNHPGGMSRVLYGQNLKKMYREFELIKLPTTPLLESSW